MTKQHGLAGRLQQSRRAIIDPTRDVAVWRWDLNGEAFGATQPNQNPDLDGTNFVFNLRYPGQRYDSATGLNYNYFRDYDPSTGRYVQSDPVGLAGGSSTYGYVSSDPIAALDPFGLIARVCKKGNKVVIVQPVNIEVGPGITREAAQKVFEEAQKVWTRQVGRFNVQLHMKNGRNDPNAVNVMLHHYNIGDQTNRDNWYIPNPSDGRTWANYDWSVFGHEVGHDLLGFPDNASYDKNTIMSARSNGVPRYAVSELDIEMLLDYTHTIPGDWEDCGCN